MKKSHSTFSGISFHAELLPFKLYGHFSSNEINEGNLISSLMQPCFIYQKINPLINIRTVIRFHVKIHYRRFILLKDKQNCNLRFISRQKNICFGGSWMSGSRILARPVCRRTLAILEFMQITCMYKINLDKTRVVRTSREWEG